MKQGKPVINIVIIAMAVVLALYFGIYLFNSLDTPYATTLAYDYTLLDSAQAEGLLVREEQVLPGQSGIVDVIRHEGERVGVSQTVAVIYKDSQAQENQAELDGMRLEAELLDYAVAQTGDVGSAARLDEDIIQSVVKLRGSAARDDFSQLEEQVLDVKSAVLKRGYTYGDGITSADLEARKQDLNTQISALMRQTAAGTSRVTAATAGTFSHLVDGMESVITPENMYGMTPEQLRSLMDQPVSPDASAVGKLITSARWYYAAVIPAAAADRLLKGNEYTMRFTGDFTQDVPMRVEEIGETVEGEAVVVFSSDRYMDRTTLLREQTAELIFDSYTGLRVPKTAVRMIKETYVDEETKEEIRASTLGVYVLVAGRTEFKQVEVLSEGDDYFVLRPAGSERKALRAGDQVITRGVDLYEGEDFRE